ncbi:calponin-2-like [Haliotis rufescens]|uniref:calponin-2-like n=1 Tax=Haliotis rufescens TaxID=6454 RepID=UPI001EAFF079|nr:calponin-2-like [Haliotis rufescens]
MAYRGPSYGLSLDCQKKTREKFDLDKAKEAISWIEKVTGRTLQPASGDFRNERDVAAVLKDGVALCELMNKIQPKSIPKIHKSMAPFQQMENLDMFTAACSRYGMNNLDIFQTGDLYEVKAMYTVVNCLHALGSLARKNGFEYSQFGVKLADKNERNFTEDQIAESNRVIGLQYGSNKVASQAGMTPYGQARQILQSPSSPTDSQPTL